MVSLCGFLAYARIDDPKDPAAEQCFLAALRQAEAAGVSQRQLGENEQAALYVYGTAAMLYDNRGGGDNNLEPYQRLLNSLRLQLVCGRETPCENPRASTPGG